MAPVRQRSSLRGAPAARASSHTNAKAPGDTARYTRSAAVKRSPAGSRGLIIAPLSWRFRPRMLQIALRSCRPTMQRLRIRGNRRAALHRLACVRTEPFRCRDGLDFIITVFAIGQFRLKRWSWPISPRSWSGPSRSRGRGCGPATLEQSTPDGREAIDAAGAAPRRKIGRTCPSLHPEGPVPPHSLAKVGPVQSLAAPAARLSDTQMAVTTLWGNPAPYRHSLECGTVSNPFLARGLLRHEPT